MITVTTVNGSELHMELSYDEFDRINNRTGNIQDVAPKLPPCEREWFITGEGPYEWKNMFGGCYVWDMCEYFRLNGKCKYEGIELKTEEDEEDDF